FPPARILSLLALPAVAGLALLGGSSRSSSQEAPAYVGANTCGICHPTQLSVQSLSAHAHSISPAAEHPLAGAFAPVEELIRPPRYHYQFQRDGNELRVRISDPKESVEVPLDWAFGAGEQAVTFVSRLNEDWYLEHYFSYYAATGKLGPTPGHMGMRSNTLELAMGLQYRSLDPAVGILQCFQCHSTAPPIVGHENSIRPAELGVRCEACHGPGSLHVQAVSGGDMAKVRAQILNPRRMSASDLNQLCGRCHRAPIGGPEVDFRNAWNVRHQPIYLSRSDCFLKSKGSLSCLTCHDAHAKLDHDLAHYDAKCASCHSAAKHPAAAGYQRGSATGCSQCHMPRVAAQENLQFTNHWIGVYGEQKLQPR
ncbi:MAG: multiheme c-type cytochrome, partial [Candidatus Korobacteraceae bacterium]